MVKKRNMKKTIIVLLIIVLVVVTYRYYKYFEHSLLVGNPVFNNGINESKKSKIFIFSYLESENDAKIFKEVWLEKKASISKEGIEKTNINLLKFLFIDKANTNFKVLDTNFKIIGFGFTNDIFVIETNNKDLIEKDTLKISIFYNNKRIDKTFLKTK